MQKYTNNLNVANKTKDFLLSFLFANDFSPSEESNVNRSL